MSIQRAIYQHIHRYVIGRAKGKDEIHTHTTTTTTSIATATIASESSLSKLNSICADYTHTKCIVQMRRICFRCLSLPQVANATSSCDSFLSLARCVGTFLSDILFLGIFFNWTCDDVFVISKCVRLRVNRTASSIVNQKIRWTEASNAEES